MKLGFIKARRSELCVLKSQQIYGSIYTKHRYKNKVE